MQTIITRPTDAYQLDDISLDAFLSYINADRDDLAMYLIKRYSVLHPFLEKEKHALIRAANRGDVESLLKQIDDCNGLAYPKKEPFTVGSIIKHYKVHAIVTHAWRTRHLHDGRPVSEALFKESKLDFVDFDMDSHTILMPIEDKTLIGVVTEETELDLSEEYPTEVLVMMSDYLLRKAASQSLGAQADSLATPPKKVRI